MGGFVGPSVLKFSLAAGALSFPATVNMRAAQVVLDPGVAMSAVSEAYARRLHLRRTGHTNVRAGDTVISGDTAGPVTIRMGAAFFRIPQLLIAKLGDLSRIAGAADIVIGADTLERTTLAIDFARGRINAVAGGDEHRAAHGFRPLALQRGPAGERRISVRIGDGAAMEAIVDLSSPHPVLMSEAAMRSRARDGSGLISTGLMATPSGPQPTVTFSLPDLAVEGTVLHDVPAEAAANWTADAPIILGLEIFEQYGVILDLQHDRLWLKPGSPKPFDRDMTGLTVDKRGDALSILHVAAHSPAAAAGLKAGASITAIDGKAIDDSYFSTNAWRWRFAAPGRTITMTIDGTQVSLITARFD